MSHISIAKADADLDKLLNDELNKFNAPATSEVSKAEKLGVRIEQDGELVGGVSGCTWGQAVGISRWTRASSSWRWVGLCSVNRI